MLKGERDFFQKERDLVASSPFERRENARN
jgi:hypothetical protein